MFRNGQFEKCHLKVKTTVTPYWATFRKIGLLFIPTFGHNTYYECGGYITSLNRYN